eukprot:Rhum_TRINITY_DN7616_c0_g1::Rhum_TRINITY_DN7616_c0_g1_i1::g.23923::m.23923
MRQTMLARPSTNDFLPLPHTPSLPFYPHLQRPFRFFDCAPRTKIPGFLSPLALPSIFFFFRPPSAVCGHNSLARPSSRQRSHDRPRSQQDEHARAQHHPYLRSARPCRRRCGKRQRLRRRRRLQRLKLVPHCHRALLPQPTQPAATLRHRHRHAHRLHLAQEDLRRYVRRPAACAALDRAGCLRRGLRLRGLRVVFGGGVSEGYDGGRRRCGSPRRSVLVRRVRRAGLVVERERAADVSGSAGFGAAEGRHVVDGEGVHLQSVNRRPLDRLCEDDRRGELRRVQRTDVHVPLTADVGALLPRPVVGLHRRGRRTRHDVAACDPRPTDLRRHEHAVEAYPDLLRGRVCAGQHRDGDEVEGGVGGPGAFGQRDERRLVAAEVEGAAGLAGFVRDNADQQATLCDGAGGRAVGGGPPYGEVVSFGAGLAAYTQEDARREGDAAVRRALNVVLQPERPRHRHHRRRNHRKHVRPRHHARASAQLYPLGRQWPGHTEEACFRHRRRAEHRHQRRVRGLHMLPIGRYRGSGRRRGR